MRLARLFIPSVRGRDIHKVFDDAREILIANTFSKLCITRVIETYRTNDLTILYFEFSFIIASSSLSSSLFTFHSIRRFFVLIISIILVKIAHINTLDRQPKEGESHTEFQGCLLAGRCGSRSEIDREGRETTTAKGPNHSKETNAEG